MSCCTRASKWLLKLKLEESDVVLRIFWAIKHLMFPKFPFPQTGHCWRSFGWQTLQKMCPSWHWNIGEDLGTSRQTLHSNDWKLKCPTFQNAQRYIAQGNILPKDIMPNMTICPWRHFAQRFFAQIDNLPKEDKLPKTTFCP